jgi:hypothetical protein
MRAYWIAFAVCAIAATVPLLLTDVLPMSDLPEHMAQVAVWKHFDDACHRFSEIYEIHWGTPYVLAYLVIRAFATFLTVSAATKVTVWLSIVLLPLSMRALLKRGSDPWLSLLGFLLAYGYSFYWGFLQFALTIPIGIFYLALLYDARRRTVALTLLALLMMTSHALVFVFCAGVTVLVALMRRSWRPLVPLVPASLLLLAFLWRLRQTAQASEGGVNWKKVVDLPSMLVANSFEILGIVVVIGMAIALLRMRPTRDLARWGPVVLAGTIFFLGPQGAFGTAYLAPRFAIFVAIGALFLFEGRTIRTVVVVLVVAWMGLLGVRFHRFGIEARTFDTIVAAIEPNRRVALLNIDAYSDHVPGPVYWHFGALVQVRQGGVPAFSFAGHDYPQLLSFRDGAEPQLRMRSTPVDGIDWPGLLQYDFILLRGAPKIAADAPQSLVRKARAGDWWLFETPRARAPRRECPPLNE